MSLNDSQSELRQESIQGQVTHTSQRFIEAGEEIAKIVVGQQQVYRRIFMSILAKGHILLEGLPGLAKTTTIKSLADVAGLRFNRIQFTPDLLPADVVGTQIYNPAKADFIVKKGPIFTDLLLADEINRAPAKVQSALLEAMGERQVTISNETFHLSKAFTVMATQNPIEQEGTYPLPEAQMDRFLFKVVMSYNTLEEEISIVERMAHGVPVDLESILSPSDIQEAQILMDQIHVDPKVRRYIVELVYATRFPEKVVQKKLSSYIHCGASPRASIFLEKAARANALLEGRTYVTPQDIKDCGQDVLRHRIALTYEAEAEGVRSEDIVQDIFDHIAVP